MSVIITWIIFIAKMIWTISKTPCPDRSTELSYHVSFHFDEGKTFGVPLTAFKPTKFIYIDG